MNGLSKSIQLKLLENDPTPLMGSMDSFAQRFRLLEDLPHLSLSSAIHELPGRANPPLQPLQQQQQPQVNSEVEGLRAMVGRLCDTQSNFIAVISQSQKPQQAHLM